MAQSALPKITLVRDAIEVVLGRLADLTDSPEVEALRHRAEGYQREADAWARVEPTIEEAEALMKRVLGLHMAVAKLGRAP